MKEPMNQAANFLASRAVQPLVSNMLPLGGSRADYDRMQDRITKGDVVMTDGYLRIESASLAATTSITFDLSEKATINSINENRLKQNDAFLATHVCMCIGIRLTADAVSSQSQETFPNDKVFTTAASLNAVQAFYNGRFSVLMNATVLVDALDVMSCMRVDSAQAGQAISSVAVTGVQGSSFWGQNYAFKSLTPNWLFNGTANNRIVLTLPESVTFTLATFTISAVCFLRGWNLQNGGTQRSER